MHGVIRRGGVRVATTRAEVAAALVYALLWAGWSLFAGYGNDDDGYSMLRTWQQLVSQHVYVPGRFQGAIPAELALGALAALGGPLLTNLFMSLCTAFGAYALHRTLRLYGLAAGGLVVAAMLANGVVLIAGSEAMDYMVAFALFAGGLWAMAEGEDVLGVVLLGAAAGTRIFYVTLAEATVVFVLLDRRRRGEAVGLAHALGCAGCAFGVAGLFYLPVWFNDGLGLHWLHAVRSADQGAVGQLVRFVYKTALFVGLPGIALAAAGWAWDRRRGGAAEPPGPRGADGRPGFLVYAGVIVALHLALYAWIPDDPSYLIPALPFAAVLLGAGGGRGALAGLVAGEVVAGLVTISPLQVLHPPRDVCGRSHASGYRVGLHLGPGLLLEDAARRPLGARCGEHVLLYAPKPSHGRLPVWKPGEPGRVQPPTPVIELAPDW